MVAFPREKQYVELPADMLMIFRGRSSGIVREGRQLFAHAFPSLLGDKNDVRFVGQRIRWAQDESSQWHLQIDQSRCIGELTEVPLESHLKDTMPLTPVLHTSFRSIVGQLSGEVAFDASKPKR